MNPRFSVAALFILTSFALLSTRPLSAQEPVWVREPGWVQEPIWIPQVIVRGEQRRVISETPIELRPNRPFHFYGNTVRRQYYRGNPLPMPQDFLQTAEVFWPRPIYAPAW